MSGPACFGVPSYVWKLILAAAVIALAISRRAEAQGRPCAPPALVTFVAESAGESWVFRRSRYSHDPDTGARVAQYALKPPIEPLDDPRLGTSGYSRTRTVLRGVDGSVDTYYRVQSYGNGRGGMDAEWERFHDAWRGSTVAGGAYQVLPGFGAGGGWGVSGWGGQGWGGQGWS
ncbi:MAG TPA: hypothetical protein PKC18_17350, partial [Lacipirellulaceae bacterium]|nr:hypothetical protein [Lacipirellulaceae bacterium]